MSVATTRTRPQPSTNPHIRLAATDPVPATLAAGLTCTTLDGRTVEHANLDHGASAPALSAVKQAVDTATRSYASVHRGKGHASQVSSRYYEAAREEVGRFVGARGDDLVIFTRQTTDAMSLLARALPAGTEVVVFDSEHHATLLPWDPARTTRLAVPRSVTAAEAALDGALSGLSAEHRLVVVTAASNVTGELWPVGRLAAVARRHGARVAVDAAQLAPHRSVDLASLGADYLAFSGHKTYAPYGTGVLVGRRDWLDAAAPYLPGGGATAEVTTTGATWHTGAARHEGGSPNVIGAVALAAACATFGRQRAAIEAHEARLFDGLLDALEAIDGVRTYSIFGRDHERVPVVTFTVDGLPADLVASALSREHGIGVRDGKFCAHPLVGALLGSQAGTCGPGAADEATGADAGTAVRVSLGLGNRPEHVTRLLAAVSELAARGPRWEYVRDDAGVWQPVGVPAAEEPPLPW